MDASRIFAEVGERTGLGVFAWSMFGETEAFCSPQARKIFAADVRDGEALKALLDHQDGERLSAALGTLGDFSLDLRLKNARWIALNVVCRSEDDHRVFVGTVADITHRVARHSARAAGEDLYRTLAENSPAMLWMGDETGKCVFLNSALREFWGIDPQDLSTFDWSSTTHPDDVQKLATPFLQAMADQASFKVEARYRRADGVYRTMRTEARPRFDPLDGSFLGMSGINLDITERLEAEQQVAESTRLRNAIMLVSPDAIVSVDEQGRFLDLNAGAERIFGYARSSVIGKPMEDLIVPEAHRARHVEGMKRYLETGQTQILNRRVEMSALRSDGSEFPAEIAVVRIPDSDPAVFTAFIRDISARKAAEEHNRMLMGELNHRTKNILSVVQAVARQTARHAAPDDFNRTFNSRLLGLAASNDLLVKYDWAGVDVAELLAAQLSYLNDAVGTRLILRGGAVRIEPKAAQTLGMAIHELSTNSLKYGALGQSEGRVDLHWTISHQSGAPRLTMCWRETGLVGVAAPAKKGFGHSVIVDMAAAALDADVEVEFADSGFQWTLRTRSSEALIR
jgi:PAS domain S-box-containing protein